MKQTKAQRNNLIAAAIMSSVNNKKTSWGEIMNAVNAADIKVTNWLEVRGVLQALIKMGMLTRTNDLHIEEYVQN